MGELLLKRIRLWAMLCLLLVGSRHVALAAGAVGIVTTASGQITIRRQGAAAFASLPSGGAFHIGDIVATGPTGKATLLFSDGSHVKLNSNTAIQITPSIQSWQWSSEPLSRARWRSLGALAAGAGRADTHGHCRGARHRD